MKYSQIPRMKYKKGTSKKKRKCLDALLMLHGKKIMEASTEAAIETLLYGQSFIETGWDENLQDIKFRNRVLGQWREDDS